MGKQKYRDKTLTSSSYVGLRLSPYLEHELTNITRETGYSRSTVLRTALMQLINTYHSGKAGNT